ncbi:MAG: hypothetical protein NC831_02650 [Candidatus Omnitrophica bacterium]|nr:hypothetical protein [Candidatus Omnitrophota bacterium]MCM8829264.1 hypothetical protein [Candidatus Omnitrophota bacterium]
MMQLKGKTVKIRFKKYFEEQRLWVFVGKVIEFSENWIMVEGKGLIVSKGKITPVDIDKEIRTLLVPRENIAHIRFLPDDFDISNIEIEERGIRYFIKVKGGPNTSIGEI